MRGEYNLLTKLLLEEGYTAENHPDYVYVNKTCYQDKENPLQNLDGGFRYYIWHVAEKTFRTPCGLQCKGISCMAPLYRNGVEFTYENDMATIICPYRRKECVEKHQILKGIDRCNVHMVKEKYQYDGSVEGILKLHDDRIRRKEISINLMRNGRTCKNHMHFDREKGIWDMNYDPYVCALLRCRGEYGNTDELGRLICPILGRPLDKKKGNVFYDVKTTFRRYDLDGTLFEGQVDTKIEKGVRFLDEKVSIDICRNIANLCKDEVDRLTKLNKFHTEMFLAEYQGREFSVEIFNIRAAERESRDLIQDLQDIRDGIEIVHASDLEKQKKEAKIERRKRTKEKKIQKIEKKILDIGFENLEWIDQNRAFKLLDMDRIDELESMREENLKKEQEKPVQLSIFDMMQQSVSINNEMEVKR